MKLSLIALSSVLALGVTAQDSSSSTSDAPAPTHSLSPTERCILECDDDDRCCRAACVEVPCPSDQQANDTNTCAAQCDQGDGSEADTKAYAECQARCITTTFFPGTATLTNEPTGTSSTDSSATTTSASDDDSSDDSNSDDSSNDDSTTNTLAPTTPARLTPRTMRLPPTTPPSSLAAPLLVLPVSSLLPGLCKRCNTRDVKTNTV
ncbi:uncharacterized protein BDV17DRAFT_79334 [Aspergillus undulatus]|uniref:uncharacterized protein n=1 Tax=Aspergillus undulatus TaxID=1810928 RepID=UPI003CCDA5AB